MFFHMWEKWYVQSEATEVCEFRAKTPAFSCSLLSAASHTFEEKSFFSKSFFSLKKVKNMSEMEWNSFVCFTVDKENCGEPAKQQRKGKNRTRRKLMLRFLSELLCLKLKLILKPAILLKFTHFQLYIQNSHLCFYETFLLKSWYFVFTVISWCVAANLTILENFKIKRPLKW